MSDERAKDFVKCLDCGNIYEINFKKIHFCPKCNGDNFSVVLKK